METEAYEVDKEPNEGESAVTLAVMGEIVLGCPL